MGWATPLRIERVLGQVRNRWPDMPIALHLHGLCAKKAPLHENARRCTKIPKLRLRAPITTLAHSVRVSPDLERSPVWHAATLPAQLFARTAPALQRFHSHCFQEP